MLSKASLDGMAFQAETTMKPVVWSRETIEDSFLRFQRLACDVLVLPPPLKTTRLDRIVTDLKYKYQVRVVWLTVEQLSLRYPVICSERGRLFVPETKAPVVG